MTNVAAGAASVVGLETLRISAGKHGMFSVILAGDYLHKSSG